MLAGALAGVGGALFAFFGRYASASYMFYHVSGEAVVWAIVGGAGTLLGPLFGTAPDRVPRTRFRLSGRTICSRSAPIAILVVMFAPRRHRRRLERHRADACAARASADAPTPVSPIAEVAK